MTHFALPLSLLLSTLLLLSAGGCQPDEPLPVESPTPPPGPQLARGLSIEAVTINQAVAIDLFRDGTEPDVPAAPVLLGRPGLVALRGLIQWTYALPLEYEFLRLELAYEMPHIRDNGWFLWLLELRMRDTQQDRRRPPTGLRIQSNDHLNHLGIESPNLRRILRHRLHA